MCVYLSCHKLYNLPKKYKDGIKYIIRNTIKLKRRKFLRRRRYLLLSATVIFLFYKISTNFVVDKNENT